MDLYLRRRFLVAVRVDVVGDLRVAVRPVLRLPNDHPHVRIDRAVRSGVG
jgi:hypothetical protein